MIVTCVSFYGGTSAWGADRSYVDTLKQLRERGVDCRLVFPIAGGAGFEMVKAAGFSPIVVPYRTAISTGRPTWRRHLRSAYNRIGAGKIARLSRQWGADVIYSNTLSITAGATAARLAGLPHVWHIRELGEEDHGWHWDLGVARMTKLIGASQGLIANSTAVGEKFTRTTGRSDIAIIHNSVRLDVERRLSPGRRSSDIAIIHDSVRLGANDPKAILLPLPADAAVRCVIAGRIAQGKGQLEAVEAVVRLHGEGVKAALWVVGDGDASYMAAMKDLVHRHGIDAYVKFVGYVKNAAPYLYAADVVLICSRAEAFGRSTVEGMLAGKPVVATASGGTLEIITDETTGLLYPPGDVPALAAKIKRLAGDAALRATIGQAGLAHATASYGPKHYTDRLLDVLSRASGKPVPQHPTSGVTELKPTTGPVASATP